MIRIHKPEHNCNPREPAVSLADSVSVVRSLRMRAVDLVSRKPPAVLPDLNPLFFWLEEFVARLDVKGLVKLIKVAHRAVRSIR